KAGLISRCTRPAASISDFVAPQAGPRGNVEWVPWSAAFCGAETIDVDLAPALSANLRLRTRSKSVRSPNRIRTYNNPIRVESTETPAVEAKNAKRREEHLSAFSVNWIGPTFRRRPISSRIGFEPTTTCEPDGLLMARRRTRAFEQC